MSALRMPPAKKRKIAAPGDAPESFDTMRQMAQDLVGTLGETLDNLEESDPKQSEPIFMDASLCLMKMKSLQRQVLDQIHKTQKTLDEQHTKRDAQELQLQNLKYQKVLNDHAISTSQSLGTSQLVQLCRSELEESSAVDTDDDHALLQRFFQVDTGDPVQRAVILDKLNQQVRARKKLETDLKQCQQQASSLKKSLASKRKLLQSLPSKLQEMERSSLPLQTFCQKSLNASKLLGTKRQTNLDLAHALPKALYTLFYLLQSSLDNMDAAGELAAMEESSMAPLLEVNKESSQVILKIPIPNISDRAATSSSVTAGFGSGKKIVSITFEYDQASNTVTAASSHDHGMAKLLVEVFPGDTVEQTRESSTTSAAEGSTQNVGYPYNWCNYLAGLHLAPSEKVSQPNMHKSATVIIRALLRRVRAQATLSWILNALSRKPYPIPVHPALKDAPFCKDKDSSVKLVSWTEDVDGGDSSKEFFLATLKCRSLTLPLRVGIHTARYPSVPPTWEFNPVQSWTGESLDDEKVSIYDDELSSLERRINQDVEQLVLPTDETTYEWILSHQLSEIATKWEEQIVDGEST